MPLYLGRFNYNTDAVKALLNQPQDRSAAAREVAESLAGELLGFCTPLPSSTESF